MISRQDARAAKTNQPSHNDEHSHWTGLPRRGHFFAAQSAKKRRFFSTPFLFLRGVQLADYDLHAYAVMADHVTSSSFLNPSESAAAIVHRRHGTGAKP